MTDPLFRGGRNIAVKVPAHEYEAVVGFYRDVLGLAQIEEMMPDVCFTFGSNQLWIDRMEGLSQAEIWLEIRTDDGENAAAHFAEHGIARRDEIERLPDGSDGFWIASPGNVIHLVAPS
ncbi:VOC family protein [Pelagibacterium lentulum]|uniref:VOC domain-containing protein n=1 Tax=Pelagibacterium lentulum TaxID=2029865 RepID=A0A916VWK8_9HYPH|nr:VOC family protein [Pelagibacterium lentulum]GGA44687.1 hypothetical protein GCM10011499_12960 [Pelagibacterium lentulum]